MPGKHPALFEMQQTTKETTVYKCRLCYKSFDESELSDHVGKMEHLLVGGCEVSTSGIQQRLCVFCGHIYPGNQLEYHHSSHHGSQRTVPWFFRGFSIDPNSNFVCLTCNFQFSDLLAMTSHMFYSAGSVDRSPQWQQLIWSGMSLDIAAYFAEHLSENKRMFWDICRVSTNSSLRLTDHLCIVGANLKWRASIDIDPMAVDAALWNDDFRRTGHMKAYKPFKISPSFVFKGGEYGSLISQWPLSDMTLDDWPQLRIWLDARW